MKLLSVERLCQEATIPQRGSKGAAGYDLSSTAEMTIPARGRALVPTGLKIRVPDGTYGRIAPRSGLALTSGIDVGAGVIDADYRGPVGVILFNHSDDEFKINVGDRIAQLILEKIAQVEVHEWGTLPKTERGEQGFGSSGVKSRELEKKT